MITRTSILRLLVIPALLLSFSCSKDQVNQAPQIFVETIASSQLPPLDSTRTYRMTDTSQSSPEAILLHLWTSGIQVQEAWMPLDNRCEDIIGPRFTVQLQFQDSRILSMGFEPGEGRLACASQLSHYVLTAKK